MTDQTLNSGSEQQPQKVSVGYVSPDLRPKSRSLTAQIRALLVECPSKQAMYEKLLQICTEQLPTTVGRIDFRIGDSTLSRMTHDPRMAKTLAERFSTEYLVPMATSVQEARELEPKLKSYQRGDQKMTLIAAPVVDITTGKSEATVSLMLGGGSYKPEVVLPRLDGIVAVAAAVLVAKTRPKQQPAPPRQPVVEQQPQPQPQAAAATAASATAAAAAAAVAPAQLTADDAAAVQRSSALSKAAQFSSTREFGYSFVNSLCSQLQAEQVFFGIAKDRRVEVEAVSGVADFKPHGPGVTSARQAMEECLDNGAVVVAQQNEVEGTRSLPIHKQWAAETNNCCICSVPLLDNEEVTGVISIRRPPNKPFTKEETAGLLQMLSPYGSAIRVIEKANRSVGSQLKAAVGDGARKNLGKGAFGRKLALGAVALGLLWFVLGSMTYRPLCRTRVTAADMHHFSSPFNAKLHKVYVRPGQHVNKGELLAEFDTADLRLELNSLKRQMSARQVEFRQAVADDAMPEAAMAKSQMTVLQAQVSAINKQIVEAKIVAPVDGTVLLSDLEQRIGQMFSQGEEIMQFAAEGDWILEIEVPDDIANYVAPEQSGTFAAASFPTEKQPFAIDHIDGSATTMQDRNVFIARAPLEARPEWMRSGMEGTARVVTVDRPVWWVAMHRVVDWGRMNFWL